MFHTCEINQSISFFLNNTKKTPQLTHSFFWFYPFKFGLSVCIPPTPHTHTLIEDPHLSDVAAFATGSASRPWRSRGWRGCCDDESLWECSVLLGGDEHSGRVNERLSSHALSDRWNPSIYFRRPHLQQSAPLMDSVCLSRAALRWNSQGHGKITKSPQIAAKKFSLGKYEMWMSLTPQFCSKYNPKKHR